MWRRATRFTTAKQNADALEVQGSEEKTDYTLL
jgi:hypothetical protein